MNLDQIIKKVEKQKKKILSDPDGLKKEYANIENKLEEIKNNKNILKNKKEINVNIEFSGLQLLRFEHISTIYCTLLGLTEEELIYYLINTGIFLKTYELGLIRQKIMNIIDEKIDYDEDLSIDIEA